MNRNLLQLVLKHAGPTADADTDALLVRRFVSTRDDSAFTALVRRHGPMVWAVCRQSVPNHADAEDAFQATFLALAQSAKSIRTPERLAGWLHAAAVRICGKAKRTFTRRAKHERATARTESDSPVSAAAWADLHAAVHAAVSDLPPSLRAAFVLCDLEGVEHGEAAKRLGLKGGTLSGQLARARQRLLAALAKRGLAAGAVALGAAVAVPDALANQVTGGAVPSAAVIELATEVTSMGVNKLKLLAAGLLVAGGLTLSGLGLLAKADGQDPKPGPTPGGPAQPPGAGPGFPGGPSPGQPGVGAPPGIGASPRFPGGDGAEGPGVSTGGSPAPAPTGEFLFVGRPNTVADVAKLLKEKSAKGWEYTGPLDVNQADPPKGKEFENINNQTSTVLVFKRRVSPQGNFGNVPMGGWSSGGVAPPGMPGGMGVSGPGGPVGGGTGIGPPMGSSSGGGRTGSGPSTSGPKMPGTSEGGAPGPGGTTAGGPSTKSPSPGGPGFGATPGGGATLPGTGDADEQFNVLKLKNAMADDVVKVIHEVFNGPNKGGATRVRLVADNRTNSVIVVKASSADMEVIQKLLKTVLDAEGKPEKK